MSDPPAVLATRRFVDAIVWGEHLVVWQSLSEAGREAVLRAGQRGGLDPTLASRIRSGLAHTSELDDFLTGVVRGLRVDFASVELAQLTVVPEVEELGADRVRVRLECPAAFGDAAWAAGSVVLSRSADRWLVDLVEPLVSRSG